MNTLPEEIIINIKKYDMRFVKHPIANIIKASSIFKFIQLQNLEDSLREEDVYDKFGMFESGKSDFYQGQRYIPDSIYSNERNIATEEEKEIYTIAFKHYRHRDDYFQNDRWGVFDTWNFHTQYHIKARGLTDEDLDLVHDSDSD
jgi:hypothetical protein